jgi:hypothetical protein
MNKKPQSCRINVVKTRSPAGLLQFIVPKSSYPVKISTSVPPMMGATPAANELIRLLAAKYAVACPFGASLSPMFPEARVTPAGAESQVILNHHIDIIFQTYSKCSQQKILIIKIF